MTPLYLAWVASYALDLETAGPKALEQRLEHLSVAFESGKPYLVSRWRWPDRFNPSFLEIYGGIDVGSNQASVDAVDGEIPGQICRPTSWNGGANRDPAILDPIGFYPRNHRAPIAWQNTF